MPSFSDVLKDVLGSFKGGVVGSAIELAKKFVTDKDKLAEMTFELKKLEEVNEHEVEMAGIELQKGQIAVNQEEAKSSDRFVAGWRPFIGWVCGVSLATNYVIRPLAMAAGAHDFPEIDMVVLMPLVFSLLGLGYLRTQEKIAKVA